MVYISEKNDNLAAAIATFANAGDSVKANAVIVNWEHTFGNIQGLAEVGKVQKATGCGVANGCNGTDATAYMVAARYLLTKRTAVYASYNKIRNGSNNTMDISGGGASSAAAASGGFLPNGSQGADPQLVAVGIIHNF